MIDILQNIWGYIQMAFDALVNLISSLGTALALVTTSVTLPIQIAGYMPYILGASVTITTTVFVVKFIVGR